MVGTSLMTLIGGEHTLPPTCNDHYCHLSCRPSIECLKQALQMPATGCKLFIMIKISDGITQVVPAMVRGSCKLRSLKPSSIAVIAEHK